MLVLLQPVQRVDEDGPVFTVVLGQLRWPEEWHVGTRVPREGITLHALPSRVVTIYPEWRSYKYILVKEEIVIIDPDTYEIVAVLNV